MLPNFLLSFYLNWNYFRFGSKGFRPMAPSLGTGALSVSLERPRNSSVVFST
jgi:hypothetical protein